MHQPFDHSVLHRCQQGDRRAQKAFFEQQYPVLFRVCLRYVAQREDAEDCLMKGFVKLFNALPQFVHSGPGSFEAWMKRIMVNECLMFLRRKSQLLFLPDEQVVDAALPADVLEKMDAEALYKLLLQLPAGYRTVFNLFAIEGYAHKEIAVLLNITESTSKSQFSKARVKLKAVLEQKGGKYGSQ